MPTPFILASVATPLRRGKTHTPEAHPSPQPLPEETATSESPRPDLNSKPRRTIPC